MPTDKTTGGINKSYGVRERISHFKRSLKQNTSPMTPLSPAQSFNSVSTDASAVDIIDNSIDELSCQNQCLESSDNVKSIRSLMPSSDNQRASFGSKENAKEVKMPTKCNKDVNKSALGTSNKGVSSRLRVVPSTTTKVDRVPNDEMGVSSEKPLIRKRDMLRKSISSLSSGCSPYMGKNSSCRKVVGFEDDMKRLANPNLGPYLLKKATNLISTSGEIPKRALELALQAKKSFEASESRESNLDYVRCLHVLASMYSCSGQYEEAIPLLERSIEVLDSNLSHDHALAKFVGCMRVGDIYAMLGQNEKSLMYYKVGLEVQKAALGEQHPRVGETCRYVVEAHIQAFQFDEAEKLCQLALDIDIANNIQPSSEEAANRRLMGLICESKGDFMNALEHFILARSSMYGNGQELDVSTLNCSIGDTYLALARYEEAILSYQKALSTIKRSKGEDHPTIASVLVHLAELYNKVGKFGESKSYCEKALEIYDKPHFNYNIEDIANGLVDLATIYQSMNDLDSSLNLLQKALEMYSDEQPSQYCTIAGIEAQMGVTYYMLGKHIESYNSLKRSIYKFQSSGATKSSLYGITLNQLGLTCVQLRALSEAAKHFEEARIILDKEYGSCHPDTLAVSSNLASTYDNLGRSNDAIDILEDILEMREEMLGTADPIVDEEKRRLARLLKEMGRVRRRKSRSLENLIDKNSPKIVRNFIGVI